MVFLVGFLVGLFFSQVLIIRNKAAVIICIQVFE